MKKQRLYYLTLLLGAVTAGAATVASVPNDRSRVSFSSIPVLHKVERTNPARVHAAKASVLPQSESDNVILELHPTEEEFNKCKVVDANNDKTTIRYYYHVSPIDGTLFDWPIYYEKSSSSLDADDWLITEGIELSDVNTAYKLSVEACNGSNYDTESFQVFLGREQSPEAMDLQVINEPALVNQDYDTYSGTFGIKEAGTYYIGIHITSRTNVGWRMMMRNLVLSTTSSMTVERPGAPTDITAVADATGKLNATVSFVYPEETINGAPLPADRDVTVTVASTVDSKSVTGKPGQKGSVVVNCESGLNLITLTSSNAAGNGRSDKINVRVGVDIPKDPVVKTTTSADNMSFVLSWDPVTEGMNGGVVVSDDVKYNVYQYTNSSDDDGNVMIGWLPVALNLEECRYMFTAQNQYQTLYEFSVSAVNSAGESEGDMCSIGFDRLGELLELPFLADYTGGGMAHPGYMVGTPDFDDQSSWGLLPGNSAMSGLGDDYMLMGVSTSAQPSEGHMLLPKLTGKSAEHVQVFVQYHSGDYTAPADIVLVGSDGSRTKVGTLEAGSENKWLDVSFAVPDRIVNLDWFYPEIVARFQDTNHAVMIHSFNVKSLVARDLSLQYCEVTPVKVGDPATVSVRISNEGFTDMSNPRLTGTVTSSDKLVAELNFTGVPALMHPGEQCNLTTSFTVNESELVGQELVVELSLLNEDDDMDNNTSMIWTYVEASPYPVVADLKGVSNENENGIELSWSNPVGDVITDSFEFLEHGDYSSSLGRWQNVDFDGQEVWGIQDVAFPNQGLPKAWLAVDGTYIESDAYKAHTGSHYIIAFCAMSGDSDDWLISEELNGADGLSFWVSAINNMYSEVLEILYSDSDPEFDSFKSLETITVETYGWKQYTAELPAGTKYVALRYKSNDQFGLMLDDISYAPANPEYKVDSYNLYRNGQKIASNITDCSATDIHPDYESNNYNVSVNAYHNGELKEYPLSNTFNLAAAGIDGVNVADIVVTGGKGEIKVSGLDGVETVTVYDALGRVASSLKSAGDMRIAVAPGFYVVSIANHTYKVVVL